MLKITLQFFIAGVLIAIALEALWRTGGYGPSAYVVERVAGVLWPSSIFKMALDDGKDSWPQVATIYALSFAANGVVYGLFGLLLGLVGGPQKSWLRPIG